VCTRFCTHLASFTWVAVSQRPADWDSSGYVRERVVLEPTPSGAGVSGGPGHVPARREAQLER
jgi:hypothetical protein